MLLTETLHVVAEIAVAFAGFASLVSIIGSRRGRDAPEVDAGRIRGMLEAALVVAAFAFIPILAHEAGLSPQAAWRTSSALFAIASASIMAAHTRRIRSLIRSEGYRMSQAWRLSAGALWLFTVGAAVATTVGVITRVRFGYLAALLTFLAYAGLLFIRLVVSFLEVSQTRNKPAA